MSEKVKLSKDGSSIDFVQSDNIPTSLKKFRQSPEIEGFYRFIFENDLQKEAFEILDRIIQHRKAKKVADKQAQKAKDKELQKAAKLAEQEALAKAAQQKMAKKEAVTKKPAINAKAPAKASPVKVAAKPGKPAAKAPAKVSGKPAKPAAKAKKK
jgi:hypothetical protein